MKNSKQLDQLDLNIIRELQQDGRASLTNIANKHGTSEATVRNRLNKLKDEGVIQIVAVADPFKLGLEVAAIIKVDAAIDKIESISNELKNIDEVWYIALHTGDATFDIEVYVPSMQDLKNLLTDVIWKIDGIKKTETSIVLSYIKRDYMWKIDSI